MPPTDGRAVTIYRPSRGAIRSVSQLGPVRNLLPNGLARKSAGRAEVMPPPPRCRLTASTKLSFGEHVELPHSATPRGVLIARDQDLLSQVCNERI